MDGVICEETEHTSFCSMWKIIGQWLIVVMKIAKNAQKFSTEFVLKQELLLQQSFSCSLFKYCLENICVTNDMNVRKKYTFSHGRKNTTCQ